MTENLSVLGVDLSKEKFDICLITESGAKEKYRTFKNLHRDFEQLGAFLKRHGVEKLHVCMEPTGRYGDKLALWLYEAGYIVSIVNAYKIKGFAISELKRSKTDKLDAGVIARFCMLHRPPAWSPRPAALQRLHDLGRYADELRAEAVREKNRLKSGIETPEVRTAIEQHLQYLERAVALLEKQMKEIVNANEELRSAYESATSIIGIGDYVAMTFLGEIGLGDQFESARQVEAFCGLNPKLKQSGTTVKGRERLSKMGNKRMRYALYMPAMSAMQHNPVIREFADRLRAAGKHPRAIIGAVMRKLVRLLFAVVSRRQKYDVSFHANPRVATF